jgi:hypothetical protein
VLFCGANAGAFDLQGHRGDRSLSPEHTLPAVAKTLAQVQVPGLPVIPWTVNQTALNN